MLTNGFQYIITCQLVQELIECSILADWIYHNTKHHYDQQHHSLMPCDQLTKKHHLPIHVLELPQHKPGLVLLPKLASNCLFSEGVRLDVSAFNTTITYTTYPINRV